MKCIYYVIRYQLIFYYRDLRFCFVKFVDMTPAPISER